MISLLLPMIMNLTWAEKPSWCTSPTHRFIPLSDKLELIIKARMDEKTGILYGGSPKYIRVHPSGNFVLASLDDGTAVLIDLRDKENPKIIETPLRNEAAAVEPNWEFLSSPYAEGGMEYYAFDDVLKNGKAAKVVFSDRRHNEYYQSSAEVPGSKVNERKFVTLLFSTLSAREYTIKKVAEGKYKTTTGKVSYLCENVQSNLIQPNISKDARFVAANEMDPKGQMRGIGGAVILKRLPNGHCQIEDRVGFATGKMNFSHPQPGHKGFTAFSVNQTSQSSSGDMSMEDTAFLYDRETKEMRLLSRPWEETSAQFPGFTKDGRVIYAAGRGDKAGLVIVDPKDLPKVPKEGDIFKDMAVCFESGKSDTGKSSHPPSTSR